LETVPPGICLDAEGTELRVTCWCVFINLLVVRVLGSFPFSFADGFARAALVCSYDHKPAGEVWAPVSPQRALTLTASLRQPAFHGLKTVHGASCCSFTAVHTPGYLSELPRVATCLQPPAPHTTLSHVKGVFVAFILVVILHCLEIILLLCGALRSLAEYLEIHFLS